MSTSRRSSALVALVLGCAVALLTLAPRIPRNFQPPTVDALPTTTCTLGEVVILDSDSRWYRCTTASPASFTIMAASGAGVGDVTGQAVSVDSEVALFSGTTGKALKRATGTGVARLTSGVLSASADTKTKCINIDPTATVTDWLFFKTEAALTVTHVRCLVGAATSVVLTLRECDANGGTCGATEAAMTCAVTTVSDAGGIDDAAVASGAWMRVLRGTVTGTPAQVSLCVTYTEP